MRHTDSLRRACMRVRRIVNIQFGTACVEQRALTPAGTVHAEARPESVPRRCSGHYELGEISYWVRGRRLLSRRNSGRGAVRGGAVAGGPSVFTFDQARPLNLDLRSPSRSGYHGTRSPDWAILLDDRQDRGLLVGRIGLRGGREPVSSAGTVKPNLVDCDGAGTCE